ncbi:MAG: hydrogenase maturation protease [Alphaproteobacteria bacterium]|nr:hydrogenase maturation protease [Alphaproteobacteria bacterium]
MIAKNSFIIGIGNRNRGDDALGCILADRLKTSFETLEHDGEPASLMEAWDGRPSVVLIDAVSSGENPGTIFHFDLQKQKLPEVFGHSSTHSFGVVEAVELARVLGGLPPCIIFFGVEGKNFSIGDGLSAEVSAVLEDFQGRIIREMEHA